MPDRQVIPAGPQRGTYEHLRPIAELLIARGHPPQDDESDRGFEPRPDGWVCVLQEPFSDDDKAAVSAAFALPPNIRWFGGMLRDSANWVDIRGAKTRPWPPPS
jgi:hypothetical protein